MTRADHTPKKTAVLGVILTAANELENTTDRHVKYSDELLSNLRPQSPDSKDVAGDSETGYSDQAVYDRVLRKAAGRGKIGF